MSENHKKILFEFSENFISNFKLLKILRVPVSSTQTSSVQHIGSTQGPHLFSTQNPSFQHQKPLSSTPKPLNSTSPSVPHQKPLSSTPKPPQFRGVLVWNWGFFGVECRGWNWCVELREVWNWGGPKFCHTSGSTISSKTSLRNISPLARVDKVFGIGSISYLSIIFIRPSADITNWPRSDGAGSQITDKNLLSTFS